MASQSPYAELVEKKGTMTNNDLEEISGLVEILLPAYPGITQYEYLQKSKTILKIRTTKDMKFQ